MVHFPALYQQHYVYPSIPVADPRPGNVLNPHPQGCLEESGFIEFLVEDKGGALYDMIDAARRRVLAADLAAGIWKIDLGRFDLKKAKEMARLAMDFIDGGVIGYALVAARKPARTP